MIELGVLGPLSFRVNGESLSLGPRLRILVLALFCEREGTVPIGRLADLLAVPGMPALARGTVRSHMSHLRSALARAGGGLAAEVLVTRAVGDSAGYALHLRGIQVDASLFRDSVETGERALHTGHYAEAGDRARQALSLWRGNPLGEATGHPFAFGDVRRFEDLHRRALIARAASRVAGNEHRAVITDLEEMITRWPGEADLRILLIIALYRSGRVGDAARACLAAIQEAQVMGLSQRRLNALQGDVLQEALPVMGLPHMTWSGP